jgi:acetyl/propionyl-CoA carboxylase alpha subunit
MIKRQPVERTIRTMLVANRGEIARRILRTCRALGIRGVAVYSEADRDAAHVRDADVAFLIGPASPRESYLSFEAVLAAAARAGADAIHPGYGFLAENAAFAEAVTAGGLAWVGPPPTAMRAMGDKAAARALAARHGVPTVPGYDANDQSDDSFEQASLQIGFPLLIKASAGGGGRGMRRVDRAEDLLDALASARREAESAFGDGRLLLERFIERPRHIEVQVLADSHGKVVHLFERECSIQRRHQKIIEESPSSAVDAPFRARLCESATSLCRAVGYESAGTVEFLVDPDRRFYFLEMNTRLQVEHPVTELVTGLDLVELQIRIAEGKPIPFSQDDVVLRGHAIEARVCAEDPTHDFVPASGTLVRFELPPSEGVRVDAGFASGDTIGIHYDSLLAKVIAWGPARSCANRRLRAALWRAWAPGLPTNLPLLRDIVTEPSWLAGDLDTGYLARVGLPKVPPLNLERGALAATVYAWVLRRDHAPWGSHVRAGFRIEGQAFADDAWQSGAESIRVRWRTLDRDSLELASEGGWPTTVRVLERGPDVLRVEMNGAVERWQFAKRSPRGAPPRDTIEDHDVVFVHLGDAEAVVSLWPRHPLPETAADEPGACVAPMPGKVARVSAILGARVAKGDVLAVIEAMKMEHRVVAPHDGLVTAVLVTPGDTVDEGAVLVRMQEPDAPRA